MQQMGGGQDGDGADRNFNDLGVRETFGNRRPALDQHVAKAFPGFRPGRGHRHDLVVLEILQGETLGVSQRGFFREVVDGGIVAFQTVAGPVGGRRRGGFPGESSARQNQDAEQTESDTAKNG
jgi:hypothetical protein